MGLLKTFSRHSIVLQVMPMQTYQDTAAENAKEVAGKWPLGYITTTSTGFALKEKFRKAGANTQNIVFVDAISRAINDGPAQADGCYYTSKPAALGEIEKTSQRLIRHGFRHFVFDSLTGFFSCRKKAHAKEFVANLAKRFRKNGVKCVFYSLEEPKNAKRLIGMEGLADFVLKAKAPKKVRAKQKAQKEKKKQSRKNESESGRGS